MQKRRAAHGLIAAAGTLPLAACSSAGPSAPTSAPATATPTPAPTPPGLPFHYETQGESSSPSFHVDRAASYKVDYVLKGSADTPGGCTVGVLLTADDGSSVPVVSGQKLRPADTTQNSVSLALTAGNWRFQEGGGCSWSVTVSAA